MVLKKFDPSCRVAVRLARQVRLVQPCGKKIRDRVFYKSLQRIGQNAVADEERRFFLQNIVQGRWIDSLISERVRKTLSVFAH